MISRTAPASVGADLLGIKARLMIIYLNKRQIADMISPEIEKPVGGILKILYIKLPV